ncbi:MAG: nitrogen regulation protein NR(I) [SAR116 cluster bacterium]|jgi:two-component system nitrogen regulation response regulator GlnG|nr:nitrogen regulation protein NR(I) [SAR116 cluster bacterium]MEC7171257.1 nitrogen regulation protein NR(I) [Pseudomonadota bacterium]MEC8765666.1 nitrogen regulation protein NR(I) [Pseudomonadota bacterium]MED5351738.1 nitrogen regulation protein NR(I) [Pseudomonadota bacterium]HAG24668.1 nitrogen regulation protein NR(I) [Alphaproteobacteria bacterium]|tara:strand:- start:1489 stop:2925 length:1437 start_codon:yes stop_codon:yes gene_type:complete
MSSRSAHILVAEDDKSVRLVVQQALARQGYTVQSSGTAAGLWKLIESGRGDVLISDIALPDGDALDLLPRIQQHRPDMPVIVMSARSTLLTAVKAQQTGVFEYLPKPFELRSLVEATERAVGSIGQSRPTAQAQPGVEEGGPLVGRSRPMQDIFKAMARVVGTDLTVLITGESGTGKELVARALHDLGSRRAGPFVPINMAAIPRNLVESELFGHEKGAFVGADSRMSGRFEQAEGGSLFLDEVGDMPPEAQTRLLRVLQDGEYLPVGANRPVKANVRIIAATNHNLQHLMQQGLFREDLFYRLNVVPLRLPPLRERTEDIAPLVNHFQKQAAAGGLPAKRFTPEAIRALAEWNWPGNVRELENLVRRLLVLVGEDSISAEMVEAELASVRPAEAQPIEVDSLAESVDQHVRRYFSTLDGAAPPAGLHGRILREVEYPLIVATLEVTRGNQVKAAEILGINRNTLRKRIRELGIWSGR